MSEEGEHNMAEIRHKVFISYHHADQDEVDKFVERFDDRGDVFIRRGVGIEMEDDIIKSTNPDYVMKRIRELYLRDSTVTLVLMGKCTWARRYVDWELQASLRHGETVTPNGLLGVRLRSCGDSAYPNRLNLNLKQNKSQEECYARVHGYPSTESDLRKWIEDAFEARTSRDHLIHNPRERFANNRSC